VSEPAASREGAVRSPAALVVTGPSGSGKTTLVVALVAELARRGVAVATVKHHGHGDDVEFDRPGKDSFRHFAAGALGSAVVTRTQAGVRLRLDGEIDPLAFAARAFPAARLVIFEGYRHLDVPKIEVRRDGVGEGEPLRAASDPRVIALVTDGGRRPKGVACPVFPPADATAIASLVEESLLAARTGEASRNARSGAR
jgi:molybdopterin-guanine dinucleotide biosynthesis protein B